MIKIAIIGTGGIAEWHANEFQKNHIQKLEIPVMGGPNVAIKGELVTVSYTHLTLPTTPYV